MEGLFGRLLERDSLEVRDRVDRQLDSVGGSLLVEL